MRVMLLLALAGWFTACSAHGPAGPAWPRPATRDADGGESLAPRAAARAIAAIAEDDHAADRAADRPAVAPAPGAAPTAAPSSAPAQDEPLPTEEIVIEVDD